MLPNIKPIIRIAIVSLTLLDTAKTANNTKKLPRLAAITILHLEIKAVANKPPNNPEPKITTATPKLAPELIPKTKGPANGFLNKVCINKPEIPKPEPTKIAVMALGSLTFKTIICQVSFSIVPKKLLKILFKGIVIDPKLILAKKQSNKTIVSPKKGSLYVFCFSN